MLSNTAVQYAAMGWAVFPCKGKVPLPGTKGYKDASVDPDVIHKVFKEDHNIAIATGKISDIFVLDVDVKNNAGGEESLQQLIKQHGELPDTVYAKTWSGGFHIFFRYVEGVKCKTGIMPGLDIRGDGGYIVAVPSIIEGKPYEWINPPGKYEITEAPKWLLKLILKPKQEELPVKDHGNIINKNRNNTLMEIGVKLRKSGSDHTTILEFLRKTNQERCQPVLPDSEVQTIAKSVSAYDISRKSEPYTEIWNSEFFFKKYGQDICYCKPLGGWFIWTGTRWELDRRNQIIQFAKQTIKDMQNLSKIKEDKELFKHSIKTSRESQLNSMVNLSKSEVTVPESSFDKDMYLLNCANGTMDLKTGEIKPADRSNYITKELQIEFDPEATCPNWEKFLDSIFEGDLELIKYMQKAVGYSLSGSIEEQCLFVLYGTGMNGKSTFLKHIYRILGDYSINAPASALMEKYNDNSSNDIARLKGTRFVTCSESGRNKRLAETQIKQLTGDDPISARLLYCNPFDFFATFKIFFATNNKPEIQGTDKGIWRRLKTIPFNKTISESEKDHKLDEKLHAEYKGILNWAIEGFRLWNKEKLGTHPKIDQFINEYRKESDMGGAFIEECCVLGDEYRVLSSDLVKESQIWSKNSGVFSLRRTDLMNYLSKIGLERRRVTSGEDKGKYFFFGIGLKGTESNEIPWNNS